MMLTARAMDWGLAAEASEACGLVPPTVGFPCIKEVKVVNSRGCVFLKQQQQNQNKTRKEEKKKNPVIFQSQGDSAHIPLSFREMPSDCGQPKLNISTLFLKLKKILNDL